MRRSLLLCAALILGQRALLVAQAPPNRADIVCATAQAHPEVFQGPIELSDSRRLAFLPTLISALNHIDGGQWGELLKTETGKIPPDIIVWRPTLDHFDVLTDHGCMWQADGAIAPSWRWLAVADGGQAPPPPPIITPPPPVVTPPPLPSTDLSPMLNAQAVTNQKLDALAENVDALRAQVAEFRQAVSNWWKKAIEWAIPALAGVIATWQAKK